MNNVDRQYLDLLDKVLKQGQERDTRAGKALSLFGESMRFNLQEGFPLLTTKKVFTKGAIHELLWFLQRPQNSHGSMNIEYLVKNGVHIWDADAFRWFKEWVDDNIVTTNKRNYHFVICDTDDEIGEEPAFEWWIENENLKGDIDWLKNLTMEQFLEYVRRKLEIRIPQSTFVYRFGDLGPVYGAQWRNFAGNGVDQIKKIINTLKTNPTDRRLVCTALNPAVMDDIALPPCHIMFQFYTRKLKQEEIDKYIAENGNVNVPEYGLSCMWTQRSCDLPLGWAFNCVEYSLLTHMIAKLVNMVPDEIICSLGDCHIYQNQIDGVKEQLSRNGSEILPKLYIHGNQKDINDFNFDDFEIVDYYPDPIIKFPLSVG